MSPPGTANPPTDVEIRDFLPEDTAGLTALDAETGPQALPHEWDAWADEPHRVLVATRGGRVIGAIHYALVGRGEAWVEGLRVAPAARRRRIGTALLEAAVAAGARYGALRTRCAAPVGAHAAVALAERAGFVEQARYDAWITAASPASASGGARAVSSAEVGELQARLRARSAAGGEPLIALGWRFRDVNPQMLSGAAHEGRLWTTDDPRGFMLFLRCGVDRVVGLLVAASAAAVLPLLDAARADLSEAGRIVVFVPSAGDVARALPLLGYRRVPWAAEGMLILARPHTTR